MHMSPMSGAETSGNIYLGRELRYSEHLRRSLTPFDMPLSSIPATTLTVLALGLLTFLIKQFIFPLYKRRAVIGHIAGPPSDNIWTGEEPRSRSSALAHLRTGNWHQLFHKNAWQFKKSIQETYGGVLKINALFGVRTLLSCSSLFNDMNFLNAAGPAIVHY